MDMTALFRRRPRFDDPDEIETMIIAFFNECLDNTIDVQDRDGNKVELRAPLIPTVSGLAFHLGVHRTTIRDVLVKEGGNERDEEIRHLIGRAVAFIEHQYEGALFNKETQRGAQFALACGFNWKPEDFDLRREDALEALLREISEARREIHRRDDDGPLALPET